MAKATANRTGLYYVAETTIGTTPATPTLTELRYTGEGINFGVETAVSEEIRSDRQTTDLLPVGQSSAGNADIELSFAEYDPFFEAGLQSDYSSVVGIAAEVTISTDATSILDSGNGFGAVVDGQWVKASGFTNPLLNRVYYVTTAAAGELIVDPAPASVEAAGQAVTITGQTLRNGVTAKSFTIQKRFNDATAVNYNNFTGMHVNGFSLNFENGAILTGSLDFIGFDGDLTTTQFAGSSDAATTANDVMNSVNNLQDIEFDGTVTGESILTMTVDVVNNLRAQNAIGSLAAVGIGTGRFEVTGGISLYFEDADEYNKFTGNTSFSLSMRTEDAAGKAYVFAFPKVKYESMTLAASGGDTDIILEGSWRAVRDPTLNFTMSIDRLGLTNADAAS